jgi:hypothetical protein
MNRARGWLGPALLVAVLILVGLMVLGVVVLVVAEQDNPSMHSYPDIDVEDMDSRTLLTVLAIESLKP